MIPEACSISPFRPTTADFPYPSTFSPDPDSSMIIDVSISPRPGATSKIPGLRSSTNLFGLFRSTHGFLITATAAIRISGF